MIGVSSIALTSQLFLIILLQQNYQNNKAGCQAC